MKLLEAMNRCLRPAGYPGVSSETAKDEASAMCRLSLERSRKRILSNGYIFNTDKIDLAVDVDGRVPISLSYLKIGIPASKSYISWRRDDDKVYLWDTRQNEWWSEPITVTVVVDMSRLDDIPFLFSEWIACDAARDFHLEAKQNPNPSLVVAANRAKAAAINSLKHASVFDNYRATVNPPSAQSMTWIILGL